MIEYKGYTASVEWSDDALFIRVLHINDLLLTHVTDAKEVMPAFRALIDDYLETCKELGEPPNTPSP